MVKALADNFLPTDNVSMEQNALVVNTGNQLVLIDTGLGAFKLMGNDTGRLTANLKAAGINPGDVDAILLTHAHAGPLLRSASPPMARARSRMRRSISRRPTTISGPTKRRSHIRRSASSSPPRVSI